MNCPQCGAPLECPTCGKPASYPYCTDLFHDRKPNPVVAALERVKGLLDRGF